MSHSSNTGSGLAGSLIAKWGRILAVVALLALAFADFPVQAESEGKAATKSEGAKQSPRTRFDTWYASTVGRNEYGVVIVNYWSKGSKLRAEVILKGYRITTIVSGKHYHIFNSVAGTGLTVERNEKSIKEDADRGRPFGTEFEDLSRLGAEKIDEPTVSGSDLKVELYQLTDDQGRRQILVTESEPRLPIRLESFVRSTGATTYLEYSGWNREMPIADTFFEPPSQIEFEQLTYREYVEKVRAGPVGPAPVFYGVLLHGRRQ